MAKTSNPHLFSKTFSFDPKILKKAGLVDPVLNSDSKLFVDPLLLSKSGSRVIKKLAYDALRVRFTNIIKLISASRSVGDAAWKAADRLLDISECKETCLGYGGAGSSGQQRPRNVKLQILKTAKEIVELGEDNPEIISLMGLFEEGVGPDTISDLCSNIIIDVLCEITEEFALKNSLPTKAFPKLNGRKLPVNKYEENRAIVLVPQDIVRDLPLATDWSDVSDAIFQVAEIREEFNRLVGPIAQATMAEKKKAMKKACLSSLDRFKEVFQAIAAGSAHYDPNEDALNFYNFRDILAQDLKVFHDKRVSKTTPSQDNLHDFVELVIDHFKHLVEKQGLSGLLWHKDVPKREKASQLLFYGIADCYCRANDIDISPEADMGGGPVDFKFSKGYSRRLVVEIKLSKGTVESGYKKQLEVYKDAARTKDAAFLIVDVGGMGTKLTKIKAARGQAVADGQETSAIYVVDGRRKLSASKQR